MHTRNGVYLQKSQTNAWVHGFVHVHVRYQMTLLLPSLFFGFGLCFDGLTFFKPRAEEEQQQPIHQPCKRSDEVHWSIIKDVSGQWIDYIYICRRIVWLLYTVFFFHLPQRPNRISVKWKSRKGLFLFPFPSLMLKSCEQKWNPFRCNWNEWMDEEKRE